MLAVVGGKGGCGKTTTTACLARALAAEGAAPVAVDADRDMPDLHLVAGAPAEPGLGRLASGGLRAATHRASELHGVRVVPAGDGSDADLTDAARRLRSLDGPVLLDAPAGASPDAAVPLRVADRALVVTTPSRESLEDAAKSAAMAETLDAPAVGSVVVRSDGAVDPAPLLDCPTLGHVPAAADPLSAAGVERAYDRVVTRFRRNI
ncbi:MinD/ParA family ATP-binding protein [Halomicrobium salinisoli]|uniref:MinD/ParA family ATP-binding protein n=1 Tax=Halomicrobium salinisoli TaxID=2878391 RepID=UPI001CF01478|nr:division plane positioning ATPase MipZ [Halomicrobium salinisoli]